jgi:2-keto-4-pentenoate hydratase/2-oxohepta-3-ene-1,7-dioic acid hydratase in catechol pathway
MVFFIKPNSAISNKLVFPKNQNSCHYEAEISFLIEDNKITAVAFGLDLTLREVQNKLKEKGLPWERAKAFDGAAVFSKFISFNDDISKLAIELYINGELKQKADYSLMINKPSQIIEEVNSFLSFEDGDILMTGTPQGVGSFKERDVFIGKIIFDGKVIIEETFKVL